MRAAVLTFHRHKGLTPADIKAVAIKMGSLLKETQLVFDALQEELGEEGFPWSEMGVPVPEKGGTDSGLGKKRRRESSKAGSEDEDEEDDTDEDEHADEDDSEGTDEDEIKDNGKGGYGHDSDSDEEHGDDDDEASSDGGNEAMIEFEVGIRVAALYQGRSSLYAGIIAACNNNGTYRVVYDDGDSEDDVLTEKMQHLQAGNKWKKDKEKNNEYAVHYGARTIREMRK
jgi:cobalamin biosynthesis protein CobT